MNRIGIIGKFKKYFADTALKRDNDTVQQLKEIREHNKKLQTLIEYLCSQMPKVEKLQGVDYCWLGLGKDGVETTYKGYKRIKFKDIKFMVNNGEISLINIEDLDFPESKDGTVKEPYHVTEAYLYAAEDSEKPIKIIPLNDKLDICDMVTPMFGGSQLQLVIQVEEPEKPKK